MGTLVLFSGGMDSTVALFWALHEDWLPKPVRLLFVDYGQKHGREEYQAATKIGWFVQDKQLQVAGRSYVLIAKAMPNMGSLLDTDTPIQHYESYDATEKLGLYDTSFVPYRNVVLLAFAAQWAHKWECEWVVTGLRGGFPDCTVEFEQAFSKMLAQAGPSKNFISPLHNRDRAETLRLAKTLPHCWEALAHTYTCFEGKQKPCGKCMPCIRRAHAFELIGDKDPALGV